MGKLAKLYYVEVGVESADTTIESHYVVQVGKHLKEDNHAVFTDIQDAYVWMKNYVKQGVVGTYGLMWSSVQQLHEGDIEEIKRNGAFDDMEVYINQPIALFIQKTNDDDVLVIV